MDKERNQDNSQQQANQSKDQQNRPGAFNETRQGDEKSTKNLEQEADLEQKRKETLTERD